MVKCHVIGVIVDGSVHVEVLPDYQLLLSVEILVVRVERRKAIAGGVDHSGVLALACPDVNAWMRRQDLDFVIFDRRLFRRQLDFGLTRELRYFSLQKSTSFLAVRHRNDVQVICFARIHEVSTRYDALVRTCLTLNLSDIWSNFVIFNVNRTIVPLELDDLFRRSRSHLQLRVIRFLRPLWTALPACI